MRKGSSIDYELSGDMISLCKHENMAYEFKDKIRQLLNARGEGVVIKRFEKAEMSFPSIFNNAGVSYNNMDLFEFNDDSWVEVFGNHLDSKSIQILKLLFDTVLSLEGLEDSFDTGSTEYVDYITDVYGYDIDEEFQDEALDEIACVAKEMDAALTGGEISVLASNFFDAIADMFCNVGLTGEHVRCNFPLMGEFLYANENNQMVIHMYSSKEVYLYDSYKDKLPNDIRERADGLISIFREPFSSACFDDSYFNFTCIDDASAENTIIMFKITKRDYFNDCFVNEYVMKLFFVDAVNFVGKELPALRQKYGNGTSAVPILFLLPRTMFHAIVCVYLLYFAIAVNTIFI
ncbi:hypothetical protein [Butyrivibrio hungatei]|uniref:Uncharacterized protein n=1 Tax=Butyrivibrio hungatei TaxID=185008 RepID=A0A1D9P5Q1_9FIRM|nr:hypothetical protein [Butyrivibrio hungatei]AOZ97861.1 hypothetical protein bhn_II062 [Butyrivibrio hungatei]